MDQRLSLAAPHICSAAGSADLTASQWLGFCGNHIFFLFWLLLLCELVITFDIWKSTILFSCKTEKKQESSCYFSELLDAFVFIFFASAIFEKILTGSRGNRQANWNLDNFFTVCMMHSENELSCNNCSCSAQSELQKISMIIRHKKCFNTV